MPETTLNLKPATATTVGSRPAPKAADLAPWQFEYTPSKDGSDANLLIMFHGMGDTKAAFAGLGRQLSLPATAVLSLQAPLAIPLMDPPAWTWFNAFDPLFNPLPNPDPSPTLQPLRALLSKLVALGWALEDIHLFGWQQGGTMALELALSVAREGVSVAGGGNRNRLGSVVSVCGKLESFPSTSVHAATPALWFTRSTGAAAQKMETALRRAFTTLEVVRGSGTGSDMPRSRGEWEGIMRFWGQVLRRGREGWSGQGEVYESAAGTAGAPYVEWQSANNDATTVSDNMKKLEERFAAFVGQRLGRGDSVMFGGGGGGDRRGGNQGSGWGSRGAAQRDTGEEGHFSRECPHGGGGGPGSGACFTCGEHGHIKLGGRFGGPSGGDGGWSSSHIGGDGGWGNTNTGSGDADGWGGDTPMVSPDDGNANNSWGTPSLAVDNGSHPPSPTPVTPVRSGAFIHPDRLALQKASPLRRPKGSY
ncbi:hypothetical protein CspeluHIS016_0103270 [Cutaneotrichosporon spelunceum]|uniref:Phospholipase/carboxylesterase/thioesterase domain-containing protein n=1 Tax=Cutaneotrichosporon spelunceum TaxID=1672016 RepID=A0AAD3TMN4_9TREE|nr:hypothetical protein CspeluHIS016_0103270 [Cutaneotrichosporon spelunceum]